VSEVFKIKSHQEQGAAKAAGVPMEWFFLNKEVDIQADLAHKPMGKRQSEWAEKAAQKIRDFSQIAEALGKTEIPGWKAVLVKHGPRARKARDNFQARGRHQFEWSQSRGIWVCSDCGRSTRREPWVGSGARVCVAAKGVLGSIDPTHTVFRSSMEDGKASVV
jgi:hypothetical protein